MAKHKPTKNQRELFTDVWQRFIAILATKKVPGFFHTLLLDENDWAEKERRDRQFSKKVRKADPKPKTNAWCKKVNSRLRKLRPKTWEEYLEHNLGEVLEWEKLWNDQWPRQAYERSRDWEKKFGDDMRDCIVDHVPGLDIELLEDVVDHIVKCWHSALVGTRRHFSIPPSMPEALAEAPVTTDGSEEQGTETTATNEARVTATTERKSVFPTPPGTPWEEVKIDFIEEKKVKVEAGGKVDEYFYDEIGFERKRDGKPTKLWGVFRNLAMLNGCASADNLTREEIKRKNVSKYISDLRKKLFELTGIRGNPFLDVAKISNYQAKFSLQATFSDSLKESPSDQSYAEHFDEEISHPKFKAKGKRKPTSDRQFERSG